VSSVIDSTLLQLLEVCAPTACKSAHLYHSFTGWFQGSSANGAGCFDLLMEGGLQRLCQCMVQTTQNCIQIVGHITQVCKGSYANCLQCNEKRQGVHAPPRSETFRITAGLRAVADICALWTDLSKAISLSACHNNRVLLLWQVLATALCVAHLNCYRLSL
jgi:hypothetical protein